MNVDTALGRGRLTAIADGVYSLLLGRELPPDESSPLTLAIYAVVLLIMVIQTGGMVRTMFVLRRWRVQPERRPRGRMPLTRHVVVPAVTNVIWAGLALVVLPMVLGGSLAMLQLQIPDIAYR